MKITQELLDKYYLGQCSPQEKEAIEQWLSEDEETATALPPHGAMQHLENRGWASFETRHPEVRGQAQRPTWSIRRTVAIAATLLLAGILFLYLQPRLRQKADTLKYYAYSVPGGKKATVTLSDGTRIHLNSGSTVRYPERFGDSVRLITFSGEAFFEVARDAAKPFVIETGRSITRVLGTAFNLREYDNDSVTTVVVTEGRVNFSSKHERHLQLTLTANQLGRLDRTSTLQQQPVSTDTHTAWKDNRLIFDDQSLDEIAHTLERWYGVQISVASPALGRQRYTGEFDNSSLQNILKSLAFAIRFQYQINGSDVTITP
ncbi:DUF4974 domain-containing protein [Parapedobacter sp. ISTM3]|uniref:FecR family protein n=1 Tax=Parapedobacter sp. ISTM3 TaxID=2800130 RepID=UPI00190673BA|nr:FecR domain-containing protein [Parapedobacter sp. ISTM3]MBK1439538.1 DUF4974 domain-containing protein [Parapedobacter sp. ISTM3]